MRNRPVAFVVTVAALVLAAGGVASAGEPPLADAGLDQQVERNTTVLLDAAGSRDPDGTIQSYQWSIETPDGREIRPLDPDVARTSFIARQSGRYEVTVTITDDDGRTASDTLYVDVSSAPVDTPASVDTPTPDGTPGPADTPAPTTTSPAVEESTPDPSSTTSRPSSRDTPSPAAGDPTPGLSADVTSSEDGALDPASPDAPPPGATATEPASPEPTDSGTDAAASAACASGTTRVKSFGCLDAEDPPATVDIEGKRYVRQWSAHTYTASVSDRPSGNERLTWSGGMGTGATRTKMFTQPPGSTVTISATVADGEGHTSSDTIVVHVTEKNRPPEVRIEGPTTACVGEPVELEGYAIASEDQDRITEATWHGDPTFVPQQPGQYEVGFSARDRQSQTARTSHTVTVRADGACRSEPVDRTGGTDKLLVRATDDNWVEGSGTSSLMRASGNVPDSGVVEKLADVGASSGKFGEATTEFVTGNQETIVLTMSAEDASTLERNIGTTPRDEVLAGANGPRINEHERLKNARVSDRVEMSNGQVKVVIRIGKGNEGSPDEYEQTNPAITAKEALTGRRVPRSAGRETALSTTEEQKHTLEHSGPVETAKRVTDTLRETVESTVDSLVGHSAASGGGTGSADNTGTDRGKSRESPRSGSRDAGSPTTGSEQSGGDSGSESIAESVTRAFDGLLGGGSSGSGGSDSDAGDSSSADSSSDNPDIDRRGSGGLS